MSSADFRIEIDPSAVRDLRKLHHTQPELIRKVRHLIDGLASDPLQGKPLSGNKRGCHSLRYGDYRIVYEVHTSLHVIHIIDVGHRREVYR